MFTYMKMFSNENQEKLKWSLAQSPLHEESMSLQVIMLVTGGSAQPSLLETRTQATLHSDLISD